MEVPWMEEPCFAIMHGFLLSRHIFQVDICVWTRQFNRRAWKRPCHCRIIASMNSERLGSNRASRTWWKGVFNKVYQPDRAGVGAESKNLTSKNSNTKYLHRELFSWGWVVAPSSCKQSIQWWLEQGANQGRPAKKYRGTVNIYAQLNFLPG